MLPAFCFILNLGAAGFSIYTEQWYLLPVNIGCAIWMLFLMAVDA